MPQNQESHSRRITDTDAFLADGHQVNANEMIAILRKIYSKLEEMERSIKEQSNAFPKNDLGKPDYDGHRKGHLKTDKDTEVIGGYKIEATKTLIAIAVTFLIGVMSSGFIEKMSTVFKPPVSNNNNNNERNNGNNNGNTNNSNTILVK